MDNIIYGRNPVIEAMRGEREIEKLIVAKDSEGSIKKLIGEAKDRKIPIHFVEKAYIDKLGLGVHQGVIAYISPVNYVDVDDILNKAKSKQEDPFLIILDGIEDPHNLGAIIRSADAAGAHGIIVPKRRTASLTETVAKASAGAIEYLSIARVSNITQTIEKLKQKGVWVGASHMEGQVYTKANLKGPIALVIGNEGEGVSRLVKEKSDFTLAIPMKGKIESLNASNAAAVLMYEIVRQRSLVGNK